ncbi:unnamed protein product [Heterobilharzia americana]|nr:unnamed protein product [Heterobilharzia americana]
MPRTEIQANRLLLGTKISLITNAQYRYEGEVAAIDAIEGTLTLQNVRFCGNENRILPSGTNQNGENKPPAIGNFFDSITFWISSISRILSLDDMKTGQNELGDKTVLRATVSVDNRRDRGRSQRKWWYAFGDQQHFMKVNALGNGRAIGNASATINRFNSSSTQYIASQPRMLVSYPRRGRGVGLLLRQTNYVPVVPIAATPGNLHKPGLSATIRNAPFKLLTTPIRSRVGPFAPRGGGRKRGQSIGRNTNKNVRRFVPTAMNPRGGVYAHFPSEVATTYQPRSTNLVPSCMGINRRRIPERRGITRDNVSVQPEIDCTKPYDFETANAELEAELAKINLNVDAVSVATTRHDSVKEESFGVDQAASTGDEIGSKRSVSSATSRTILTAATNENGASGDSSSAVVISTVRNNVDAHTTESQNPLESTGTLAK